MVKGQKLRCSFCGKSQENVKKLIAGPGVYICDECVGICNEIIDEKFGKTELLSQKEIDALLKSVGAEPDGKDKTYRCSFCGKSKEHVEKLVAGPKVYICNECIKLCNEILREENIEPKAPVAVDEKFCIVCHKECDDHNPGGIICLKCVQKKGSLLFGDGNNFCSFCGKSKDKVEKLIAGPDVFICVECVILCNEILLEEKIDAKKSAEKSFEATGTRVCLGCRREVPATMLGIFYCLKCISDDVVDTLSVKCESSMCSFCGKRDDKIRSKRGYNICDECVGMRDFTVRVSD